MERLTTKYIGYHVPIATCSINRFGEADDCDSCEEVCVNHGANCDTCPIQKALSKLAEYEDLEEQGLLLKLPCKVGDKLYVIRKLCDGKETKVIEEIVASSFDIRPLQKFVLDTDGRRLNFSKFGQTVFLTKEEAEQALKAEQEGGSE